MLVPFNAGEILTACPGRCPDTIWTFFNEKWNLPPAEVRETVLPFSALDITGERKHIPAGARLEDVRLGPPQTGPLRDDPKLAAFRYDGQVCFVSAEELFEKTIVVG